MAAFACFRNGVNRLAEADGGIVVRRVDMNAPVKPSCHKAGLLQSRVIKRGLIGEREIQSAVIPVCRSAPGILEPISSTRVWREAFRSHRLDSRAH